MIDQDIAEEERGSAWWAFPIMYLIILAFFGQCWYLYLYASNPQNDKTNIAS